MKKRLLLTVAAAAPLLLGGCANSLIGTGPPVPYDSPVIPPSGLIYSDVKHPLTAEFHATPVGGSQMASDKTHYFWIPLPFTGIPRQLWPSFGWGENSITGIAEEGGLNEVSYAEADVMSILSVYTQMEVTVYGQ